MIFTKTAQTLIQTKEKERLTGDPTSQRTPHVIDPIAEARLDGRDLVDGEVSAMAKSTIVLPTPFRIEWYPKP